MEIIFSDDFVKQFKAIELLKENGNIAFAQMYNNLSLCVKALSQVNSVDELPFFRRSHIGNPNNPGYLGFPLDKCLNVDLDNSNRVLTFEKDGNAVVLNFMGHYNIQIYNGKCLFTKVEEQFTLINRYEKEELESLRKDSEYLVLSFLNDVKDIPLSTKIVKLFDENYSKNICPLTVDVVTVRLNSYLNNNEQKFKNANGVFDSKLRDNAILNFFKDNERLLKEATLNARCVANAIAIVEGNGDLKKTMFTKLDIDYNIIRNFSDLIYYCNGKVQSPSVKKEVFNLCAKVFLKGYDQKFDNVVEFKNSRLGSFDYRNDYEVIKRLNVYLRKTIEKDLISCIKSDKKCYIRTIFKKNSDELFATLTPNADLLIKVFRKNCRKLNLNRYGKSRENHELICKKLGLKAGSLLKTKESDIVHKQHKKKGIKR